MFFKDFIKLKELDSENLFSLLGKRVPDAWRGREKRREREKASSALGAKRCFE